MGGEIIFAGISAPSSTTTTTTTTTTSDSDGGCVLKWDLNTGMAIGQAHKECTGGITLVPPCDGSLRVYDFLALNEPKQALLHYRLDKERPIHRFFGQDQLSCLQVSPDRRCLIAGTDTGKIWAWELETGQVIFHLAEAHLQRITVLRVSSDGYYLVSGSSDGSVKVWRGQTPKNPHFTFSQHTGAIRDIKIGFGIEGNCRMVSASDDGAVLLLDLIDGHLLGKFIFPTAIRVVLFTSTEGAILAGAIDGTIYIIDLTDTTDGLENDDDRLQLVYNKSTMEGREMALRGGHMVPISSMSLSLTEDKLISGDESGKLIIWNWTRRQMIRQWDVMGSINFLTTLVKESCTISTGALNRNQVDCQSLPLTMAPPKRTFNIEGNPIMVPILPRHNRKDENTTNSQVEDDTLLSTSLVKLRQSYSRLLDFVFSKYDHR